MKLTVCISALHVQVTQLSAEQFAQDELYDRLNAINERLNTLKIESEEVPRFLLAYHTKKIKITYWFCVSVIVGPYGKRLSGAWIEQGRCHGSY